MLSQEYWDNFAQDFFLCIVAWNLSNITASGFDLCKVVPRVLRQNYRELFLMQCCLEPVEQCYIEFWPVQCCPKSIKAKLHRIIFYAMLPEASRTTLHRVWRVQCCPKSIKTTFHKIFSYPKLPGASWTTFHRVLTCAMLSQEY